MEARAVSLLSNLTDWRWRLDNLYWIIDKEGRRVQFKLNWAQEALFSTMHFMNVILKARQLGFTTFIQVFMLDACVFNDNVRAGTIAHKLDDAKTIFRDKVKFPYESLPEGLRNRVHKTSDSADELLLSNNSSIRVGTSLRSGTLNYLHISEYGKLCAQFPEKAREVRTGALNTVQTGQIVFLESTAEGQEGHFYELSQSAQAKQRKSVKLTPLDFKFFFFPWWKAPEYEIDPDGVVIDDAHRRYFEKLEKTAGIVLSDRKKAWYVKKAETQLGDMKREYPSTAEEAFEASVEGAYYAEEIAAAELQGRIGAWAAVDDALVHTVWDIGVGDTNAIWFYQIVLGRPRIVGYLANTGEGAPYYIGELRKLAAVRKWQYGTMFLPHDAAHTEWGSGRTRVEQVRDAKLGQRWTVVPIAPVDDGINAVRATLPLCTFDEAACSEGLKALKAYRKEWDDNRGTWKDKPRHDWASHGADAFRIFAQCWREPPKEAAPRKARPSMEAPAITAKPDGMGGIVLEGLETPMQFAQRRQRRRNALLHG
jgi:hypothetical protein